MDKYNIIFFVLIFITTSFLSLVIYNQHSRPQNGIDDAQIFMKYAENLSNGYGFRYNEDGERVEGFTSLLWVLICAIFFSIDLGEKSLIFISCFMLVLTVFIYLFIIARIVTNKLLTKIYQVLFLLLLFSSTSFLTWTTITLMDTGLWTYILIHPPKTLFLKWTSGLIISLMIITRPESMLIIPILVFLVLLRIYVKKRHTILLSVTPFMLPSLILFLFLLMFRILYFGYPLPNTYYAKVSPSFQYNLFQGKIYLESYMKSSLVCSMLIIIMVCIIAWRIGIIYSFPLKSKIKFLHNALPQNSHEYCAFFAISLILIPVIMGGDHFKMFRFFQPAFPLMCLFFVLYVQFIFYSKTKNFTKNQIIGLLFVLLPLSYCLSKYGHVESWNSLFRFGSPIQHEFEIANKGILKGQKLNKIFAPVGNYPTVGVITVGGFGRKYDGKTIDLMGLNNTIVAHTKGERKGWKNHAAFETAAFYQILPDVLLAHPPNSPSETNVYSIWLKDIFKEPKFRSNYIYGVLEVATSRSDTLKAFFKKSFINSGSISEHYIFNVNKVWTENWIISKNDSIFKDK